MPLVRVRTYLGKRLLGEPTRPYASEVTVKAVVDRAIEQLEGVELVDTVNVYKDAAEKNRTAQLPLDCLDSVSVGELVCNDYGTNLVTHVVSTAALQTPDCGSNARLQRSIESRPMISYACIVCVALLA